VRIGLDLTRSAVAQRGGIGRYAVGLAWGLLEVAPEHEYFACYRLSALRRRGQRPLSSDRVGSRFYWDRFAPLLAKSLDVFHGLESRAARFGRVKQVVTLHEVMHLWMPLVEGDAGRERREREYAAIRERADVVITPSEFERQKILEHLELSEDRVRAVPLAPAEDFGARLEPDPAVLSRLGVKGPYLLFVGWLHRRKNILRLLDAFALLKPKLRLVLAGAQHPSIAAEVDERIAHLDGRALKLGFVADADLPHLYAGARAFLLPSEYESFGIPILEAMACGCPVITSDAAAMPEVAGGAAQLCDPTSVDSIAGAMRRVVEDDALWKWLRMAGLARARQFTWPAIARRTLEIYREVA
jgi:glycosyltransferase involved in cell wall biosynthesis